MKQLILLSFVFISVLCFAQESYSVVIMGDTHFDTEPSEVYHSCYNEPTPWLNKVQRAEFARNGEMWRERCPRMVERASRLIGEDTRFVYQTGDLILYINIEIRPKG